MDKKNISSVPAEASTEPAAVDETDPALNAKAALKGALRRLRVRIAEATPSNDPLEEGGEKQQFMISKAVVHDTYGHSREYEAAFRMQLKHALAIVKHEVCFLDSFWPNFFFFRRGRLFSRPAVKARRYVFWIRRPEGMLFPRYVFWIRWPPSRPEGEVP